MANFQLKRYQWMHITWIETGIFRTLCYGNTFLCYLHLCSFVKITRGVNGGSFGDSVSLLSSVTRCPIKSPLSALAERIVFITLHSVHTHALNSRPKCTMQNIDARWIQLEQRRREVKYLMQKLTRDMDTMIRTGVGGIESRSQPRVQLSAYSI